MAQPRPQPRPRATRSDAGHPRSLLLSLSGRSRPLARSLGPGSEERADQGSKGLRRRGWRRRSRTYPLLVLRVEAN